MAASSTRRRRLSGDVDVRGIGLMIAEAHIGAFGAIGVGGVAAFVIGALYWASCAIANVGANDNATTSAIGRIRPRIAIILFSCGAALDVRFRMTPVS